MRGAIGEIEACAGGADVAAQRLDEVIAIVRTVGEPPSDAFVTVARAQLTAKGSPLVSSMLRDVERGRPIEVEAIVGDLLRRGAKAETAAPLLAAAYVHLAVYRSKVAAAR